MDCLADVLLAQDHPFGDIQDVDHTPLPVLPVAPVTRIMVTSSECHVDFIVTTLRAFCAHLCRNPPTPRLRVASPGHTSGRVR